MLIDGSLDILNTVSCIIDRDFGLKIVTPQSRISISLLPKALFYVVALKAFFVSKYMPETRQG